MNDTIRWALVCAMLGAACDQDDGEAAAGEDAGARDGALGQDAGARDGALENDAGPLDGAPERDAAAPDAGDIDEFGVEVVPIFRDQVGGGAGRFYEIRFRGRSAAGAPDAGAPYPPVAIEPRDVCRPDHFFVQYAESEWPQAPGDPPLPGADGLRAKIENSRNFEGRYDELFVAGPTDGVLAARPEALCAVVSNLRTAAQEAAMAAGHATPRHVRVGRVCGFGPQEIAAARGPLAALSPDHPLVRWHLERIGLTRLEATVPLGVPGDVVLVDTGVDDALLDDGGAGLVQTPSRGAEPVSGTHGTMMALLVRQLVAPADARLHSVNVFGADGESTPGALAEGIARGLARVAPSEGAVVVNLSVGWPPELSQPRDLTGEIPPKGQGGTCGTLEDGIGEEVRHILTRAGDLVRGRPLLVVASAGNRPGGSGAAAFQRAFGVRTHSGAGSCNADCQAPLFRCAADQTCAPIDCPEGKVGARDGTCIDPGCAPGGLAPRLFFPAAWGEPRVGGCSTGSPHVLAVGSVDAADRPSELAPLLPPLVAPGDLVFASHRDLWPERGPGDDPCAALTPCAADPGACGAGEACVPNGAEAVCAEPLDRVRLPFPVTGTSAAAALVTGVAAQVQRALAAPLDGEALAAWLHGTGDALDLPDRPRRLSACAASSLARCPDLVTCVARERAMAPCEAERTACPESDACGRSPDVDVAAELATLDACAVEEPAPVEVQPKPACADAPDPCAVPDCEHLCVDGRRAHDRHSLGRLGPQPTWPGCLTCSVRCRAGVYTLDMYVSPSLRGYFGRATVVVRAGGSASQLSLAAVSPAPSTWQAGKRYLVSLRPPAGAALSTCPLTASARLEGTVTAPDGVASGTSVLPYTRL